MAETKNISKNTNKRKYSRIQRLREDTSKNSGIPKHRFAKAKTILVCASVVLIAGCVGAEAIHQSHAHAHQVRVSRQQEANEVSCTVHAAPGSTIYNDGNEIGHTDKTGSYNVSDISAGSKLTAKYGADTSNKLVLTRKDKNKNLQFTFNYLKGQQAQNYMNHFYRCISNASNHNDQMINGNFSLDNYFVKGGQNDDYQNIMQTAKYRYQKIQKMREDRRQHHIKKDDLTAVHYITEVSDTSLNKDGTVTIDFTTKRDMAFPDKDQIKVAKYSALLTKVNGNLKITKIQEVPKSVHEYTE